jgi:hypothetical protein
VQLTPTRFLLPAVLLLTSSLFGQKLQGNQTEGFGARKQLVFTYTQNFDCVDQPVLDLNYNGIPASSDPGEMQTPICVVGATTTINPPGQPVANTEPLWVLVPMFSVDNDQNPNDAISCDNVVTGTLCGTDLGNTLIELFGNVPEAFKAKPLVYTQCPDSGTAPGTCTMHASRLDLGKALAELGILPPPTANVFLPTPNHSHIVSDDATITPQIWWLVKPALVFNPNDWPSQDGKSGITSLAALRAAQSSGDAAVVPSNFFLFFSSNVASGLHSH